MLELTLTNGKPISRELMTELERLGDEALKDMADIGRKFDTMEDEQLFRNAVIQAATSGDFRMYVRMRYDPRIPDDKKIAYIPYAGITEARRANAELNTELVRLQSLLDENSIEWKEDTEE